MTTTRPSMPPTTCGVLLASLLVGAVVKPWPPAPPDVARIDVEEVYQFDEGARPDPLLDGYVIGPGEDRPRPIRAGEDVLIFDFGDEGMVPGDGEAEEWRRP